MSTKPQIVKIPYTHTFKSGKESEGFIRLIHFGDRITIHHKKPTGGNETVNFPAKSFDALLEILKQRAAVKPKPLTVGYRARFKKRPHHWDEYAGRDVLLTERNSSGEFSVMVLPESMKELKVTGEGVGSGMSWVEPECLEFVDSNVEANMAYIDACEGAEDFVCPDCEYYDGEPPEVDGEYKCPECGCQW